MYKTLFTLTLISTSVAAYGQQQSANADTTTSNTDIERIVVTGDFRQTTLDQLSASATI